MPGARAQVAPEAVVAQVQGAVEAVLRAMPHPVDRALYLGTVFASVAGGGDHARRATLFEWYLRLRKAFAGAAPHARL